MKQFYEENEFKTFVDAYCTKHHVTVGVALKHATVIATAKYYGYEEKE